MTSPAEKTETPAPSTRKGRKTQGRVSRSNREKILRLALEGDTRPQIAKATGLSERAVREELEDPHFKQKLAELRENRLQALSARLEYSGQVAISSLVRNAMAGTTGMPREGDRAAVMAADSILDRIGLVRTTATKSTETKVHMPVPPTDEFAGRTVADLEFYAANGCFPEDV